MGDGGAGVGGVRQLVRGQRGHASGREAPREEVVECRQLVGSRLLTPASTAVTEPDLGASRVENGGLSLAPGGELRLSENRAPPPTGHHPPPSQHHPLPRGHPHLGAAWDSVQNAFIDMVPFRPREHPLAALLSLSPFYRHAHKDPGRVGDVPTLQAV